MARSPQGNLEFGGSPDDGESLPLSDDNLRVLEGNRFTRFLFAPVRKEVISGVASLVFSVAWALSPGCFSAVFTGESGVLEYAGVAATVAITIAYLALLIGSAVYGRRFERAGVTYRRAYNRLVRSNNALVKVLSGQKAILTQVSRKANDAIHAIEVGNRVDPTFWAFEDSCQSACDSVRRVLLDYRDESEDGDIEVGYVKLDEDAAVRTVQLCAFSGGEGSTPRILWASRRVDADPYFDSRLFREGRDGVIVLQTNEEIQESFFWPTGTVPQSRMKYTQYSAVPVFCNRGHRGSPKMIGLFEVSCLGGSLGGSRREVEDVMKSLVSPYGSIMLVIHKLHKGVHVRPPSGKLPILSGRKRCR